MKTSFTNKIAWAIITVLLYYITIQFKQNRILPQDLIINVKLYYSDSEIS